MKIKEMQDLLEKSLPPKRYKHSLRVYDTALAMVENYALSADYVEKIAICALLHDCGREYSSKESVAAAANLGVDVDAVEINQPILLHAKLGKLIAQKKYGVQDQEILDGIAHHTTGAAGMTVLEKIVFLADMLEPARDFPRVDYLRKLASEDLDAAMLLAYSNTMQYLLESNLLIHPHCIDGYNEEVLLCKKKGLKIGDLNGRK